MILAVRHSRQRYQSVNFPLWYLWLTAEYIRRNPAIVATMHEPHPSSTVRDTLLPSSSSSYRTSSRPIPTQAHLIDLYYYHTHHAPRRGDINLKLRGTSPYRSPSRPDGEPKDRSRAPTSTPLLSCPPFLTSSGTISTHLRQRDEPRSTFLVHSSAHGHIPPPSYGALPPCPYRSRGESDWTQESLVR